MLSYFDVVVSRMWRSRQSNIYISTRHRTTEFMSTCKEGKVSKRKAYLHTQTVTQCIHRTHSLLPFIRALSASRYYLPLHTNFCFSCKARASSAVLFFYASLLGAERPPPLVDPPPLSRKCILSLTPMYHKCHGTKPPQPLPTHTFPVPTRPSPTSPRHLMVDGVEKGGGG